MDLRVTAMRLNELRDNPGARTARKRVGRGIGSGTGKTAGRGHKGQKSRSGVSLKGFEGGQMPLHRRLPKRGFNNSFALRFNEVNLERVQKAIDAKKLDASKPVTVEALLAAGVIRRARDGVRLLAKGAIKGKIAFEVTGASKPAIAAVEKAGGSVTLVAMPKRAAGAGKTRDPRAAKRLARARGDKTSPGAHSKPANEKKNASDAGKKADS